MRFLIVASTQVLAECETPHDVMDVLRKRPSRIRIHDTWEGKVYYHSQFIHLYMRWTEGE